MSLVGPRPERPELQKEIEKEVPEFGLRLQASLMFYDPTPYTKLIVAINNERDKYDGVQERKHFIPLLLLTS